MAKFRYLIKNTMLPHNDKQSNSKLCAYGGYKLSSVVPDIACSNNVVQINIGCDDDDTFYSDSDKAGRVQIIIETEESVVYVDLEDVLEFAKKYCAGIFSRVSES